MAHRAQIEVSPQLIETFKKGDFGVLKIIIEGELLKLVTSVKKGADKTADFANAMKLLEENKPCYIVLRLDQKYILLAYVPPDAVVREKMMYAASRQCLKDGLGSANFIQDYFFPDLKDCTAAAYEKSISQDDHKDIMTTQELWKLAQAETAVPSSSKEHAMATLPIHPNDAASKAFAAVKGGGSGLYVFNLDKDQNLSGKECKFGSFADIAAAVHPGVPAYLLFNFKHDKDGDKKSPTIFVYYCPEAAKIQERMVYSTCKRPFVESCDQLGIELARKIECSDPKTLSADDLMNELYPKAEVKQTFAKPARPGKGKARIIKSDDK